MVPRLNIFILFPVDQAPRDWQFIQSRDFRGQKTRSPTEYQKRSGSDILLRKFRDFVREKNQNQNISIVLNKSPFCDLDKEKTLNIY